MTHTPPPLIRRWSGKNVARGEMTITLPLCAKSKHLIPVRVSIAHSERILSLVSFAENHVPVGGAPGLLGAPRVPSRIPMQPHEPRKSGDKNHARRNASDGRSRPSGLLRRL